MSVRRTYRRIDGQWVEVTKAQPGRFHYVQGDYPDYQSPIDGTVVHGKRGRRYDLEANQCRPWEGREAEQREADRRSAYHEQALDRQLHESTHSALAQMHPAKRRILGA